VNPCCGERRLAAGSELDLVDARQRSDLEGGGERIGV
jgi:hypothetical protein